MEYACGRPGVSAGELASEAVDSYGRPGLEGLLFFSVNCVAFDLGQISAATRVSLAQQEGQHNQYENSDDDADADACFGTRGKPLGMGRW